VAVQRVSIEGTPSPAVVPATLRQPPHSDWKEQQQRRRRATVSSTPPRTTKGIVKKKRAGRLRYQRDPTESSTAHLPCAGTRPPSQHHARTRVVCVPLPPALPKEGTPLGRCAGVICAQRHVSREPTPPPRLLRRSTSPPLATLAAMDTLDAGHRQRYVVCPAAARRRSHSPPFRYIHPITYHPHPFPSQGTCADPTAAASGSPR
jgi:hypothetical protein